MERFVQYVEAMQTTSAERLAVLGRTPAPSLRGLAVSLQCAEHTVAEIAADYGHDLLKYLQRVTHPSHIGVMLYSGSTERASTRILLAALQFVLDDRAFVVLDNADFPSVYAGIREALMSIPGYRFLDLVIDPSPEARAGQGLAVLRFEPGHGTPQATPDIPASKHKRLDDGFAATTPRNDRAWAEGVAAAAVASWTPRDSSQARAAFDAIQHEFPDDQSPQTYWHDASQLGFTDFFSWGHDQEFGFGLNRKGAMSTRHVEILAECLEYGYLNDDLRDRDILDVGCWTGGDILALAGLGANVTAIEEHPVSARAAAALCAWLKVPASILNRSLYREDTTWRGRFDVVYLSGVVYHVTDPLLALRICFSYLKPGGRLIVETKACHLEGPYCEYGGTLEKGWNWYAPTLETLGRWLVDVGFARTGVAVHLRPMGRLLACAVKSAAEILPDRAGFSRPGSWLEEQV